MPGQAHRLRSFLLWTSWLPLASFVWANHYVDQFEGWGQWAAAPILLGPVFLSALFVVAGALVVRREQAEGGVLASTWVALALSSVPCLWLVWRLIVTL